MLKIFRLLFVFRIFVVVFVSAPACLDMFSVSLSLSLSLSLSFSLSLLPIDVAVYLSIFFARLGSNVFAKQGQVQS